VKMIQYWCPECFEKIGQSSRVVKIIHHVVQPESINTIIEIAVSVRVHPKRKEVTRVVANCRFIHIYDRNLMTATVVDSKFLYSPKEPWLLICIILIEHVVRKPRLRISN